MESKLDAAIIETGYAAGRALLRWFLTLLLWLLQISSLDTVPQSMHPVPSDGGRPHHYKEYLQKDLEDAVNSDLPYLEAAALHNVPPSTVWDHREKFHAQDDHRRWVYVDLSTCH